VVGHSFGGHALTIDHGWAEVARAALNVITAQL
jgi:hypothetical protein